MADAPPPPSRFQKFKQRAAKAAHKVKEKAKSKTSKTRDRISGRRTHTAGSSASASSVSMMSGRPSSASDSGMIRFRGSSNASSATDAGTEDEYYGGEEGAPPHDFASVGFENKNGAETLPRGSSLEYFSGTLSAEEESMRGQSFESSSSNVFSFIRANRVRRQMSEREAEFTERVPIRCVACTWNVNGKKSNEDLASWLLLDRMQSEDDLPSIYAVGFQEIVDFNAGTLVISDSQSKDRSSFWAGRLSETLNRAALRFKSTNRKPRRYQLVLERHLVGLLICVFVLDSHIPHVREPQATHAATGIMGVMGNKGGVVARLQLYDSTICFVCAHLAAHRDNVGGRNSDYHSINAKTTFKEEKILTEHERRMSARTDSSSISSSSTTRTYGIADHEYVVWLGDFNYRIDTKHSTGEVHARVNAVDFPWLLRNDQLNIERASGRAFVGFEESSIDFLPTYKFQPGTDLYERRPDKKLRAPAWCDRVLYSKKPNQKPIVCATYERAELKTSDHKPVMADLRIPFKVIVEEKRDIVYREVIRALDKWENDCLPKLELSTKQIQFGDDTAEGSLRYLVTETRSVVLENTGQVQAAWRFITKPGESRMSKPWIQVTPHYGLLLPGEKQTVTIACCVYGGIAAAVLCGLEVLEDFLIIRLEKGGDHYILVSGKYEQSCFGSNLQKLITTHAPFRPLKGNHDEAEAEALRVREGELGAQMASTSQAVPKELWRLLDRLSSPEALSEPNIFFVKGDEMQRQVVRECLDAGQEFPKSVSHHSIASTALDFLRSLAEPVVPISHYPNVDFDHVSPQHWCSKFLENLPPLNLNVLVYIVSFLKELLLPKYTKHNELSLEETARLFARVIFRPGEAVIVNKTRVSMTTGGGISENISSWLTNDQKEHFNETSSWKLLLHLLKSL